MNRTTQWVSFALKKALIWLVFAGTANASAEKSDTLDMAQKVMEQARVPGLALARIESGKVAWTISIGQASDGEKLAKDHVFNVASLTKPLFGTTIMHLVEADLLQLDQPVAEYWVDPDIADDPRHKMLTPRLLLSHQGGLPNWRGAKPLAFMFEPGSRAEYSGEGYEFLRRAAQTATGKSWTEIANQYITEPLGMHQTWFGWNTEFADRLVSAYEESGEPLSADVWKGRGPNAAANTFTTITDYARFVAATARGAGVSPAAFEQMTQHQMTQEDPAEFFSLGWRIIATQHGPVLFHDGREAGLRTLALVHPATQEGLVVLTNSSNGELTFSPLIEHVMLHGDAILHQQSLDTWQYLMAQPVQAHGNILSFIAQSPTYTYKLLQAARAGLDMDRHLDKSDREKLSSRIDQFVMAHNHGRLEVAQVGKTLMMLGSGMEESEFTLATSYSARQTEELIKQLAAVVPE